MRHALAGLVLAVLLGACAHGEVARGHIAVAREGATSLVVGSGLSQVRVRITMRPADPHDIAAGGEMDETGYIVTRFVQRLEILVGPDRLYVPRSVFCDLFDLQTAELHIAPARSELTLTGADAAESYIVKIEFDRQGVKRRTMASGEFPHSISQDTRYERFTVKDE